MQVTKDSIEYHAEWTKLRALRSTRCSALTALVLIAT